MADRDRSKDRPPPFSLRLKFEERAQLESDAAGMPLYLAKGDRRGHVAVTYEGEVMSIARYTGKKVKEIEARLGSPDALRSVEATKAYIADTIVPKLQRLRDDADTAKDKIMMKLDAERLAMKQAHKEERKRLEAGLAKRQLAEDHMRAARFRSGVKGVFDRLSGRQSRIRKQNELEAFMALQRDREQRHAIIAAQLVERRELQRRIDELRERYAERVAELHRDISRQMGGYAQAHVLQVDRRQSPEGPKLTR